MKLKRTLAGIVAASPVAVGTYLLVTNEVGRSLLLIVGAIIVAVVLVVIWLHLVRYASTGGDL